METLSCAGGQYEEEELVKEVKTSDIIDLFTNILNSTYASQIVTEYITTSAMKLSIRLSDPAQVERIRRFLSSRTADLDVEVQQRAVEYSNLFGHNQIRRGVLERMPPPEIREEQQVLGEPTNKRQSRLLKDKSKRPPKQTEQDILLDLMGGSDAPAPTKATANGSQNTADLLADIFGGDSATSPAPQPVTSSNNSTILDLSGSGGTAPPSRPAQPVLASQDLLGGLGGVPSRTTVSSPPPGPPAHTAFSKNDLLLTLQVQRNPNGGIQIHARFRNNSNFSRFTGVGLQAAVPRSQRLQLNAINKPDLEVGEEGSQGMKVAALNGVSSHYHFKPNVVNCGISDNYLIFYF